jgi:hypothetical protein
MTRQSVFSTAPDHRHQNNPKSGTETPGDTNAPDISGRTGEEMPDAPHDSIDELPPGNDRRPEDQVTS